jgi:indolepyruvate ferredoxin oxidoreductase
LRGTPFDVFGYAAVRREERRLVPWYRTLVEEALDRLTPENAPVVTELARVPDAIRGYEEIKLKSVAAARSRADELLGRLHQATAPAGTRS